VSLALFDVALQSTRLDEADLNRLRFFEVQGVLVSPEPSPFKLSTDPLGGIAELGEQEVPRLRRAGLKAFATLALPADVGVGPELEQALHRLTPLLGDSRVVAIGPCRAIGNTGQEHVFARHAELARELNRPFLAETPPRVEIREVRRLLSLLRECRVQPERTLLLGLPWASLRLALEYGYFVALTVAGTRHSPAKLLDAVNRLGGQRLMLGSGGGDYLAVPKAAATLEEGAIPRSVRRRLLWSNAIELLRLQEAMDETP